ncbi:MAG TPA: thioesterase [Microscillaceae bacterium]|nr:thioesterase [Microscillaceae bacterium]
MIKPKNLAELVYHHMMAKDYCSQWMQIEPLLLEEGHCKIQMVVKRDMLNGYGILHGGIAFAFADSAFAFVSNAYGRVAVSINSHIVFSKSAKEGERLLAEAKVLKVSHKTIDIDVNVMNEQGEVYYFFRGTAYRKNQEVIVQQPNSKDTLQ